MAPGAPCLTDQPGSRGRLGRKSGRAIEAGEREKDRAYDWRLATCAREEAPDAPCFIDRPGSRGRLLRHHEREFFSILLVVPFVSCPLNFLMISQIPSKGVADEQG